MPPTLTHPLSDRPIRDHRSGPRHLPNTGVLARPRALVVDDDDSTREMYAWCLRAGGWLVKDVGNGEEAILVAADFSPDVIVMDLRLPILGGPEATRQLKADPRMRHIPVVALSGIDRAQAEAIALEAGCEVFVAKPCPPEELRAILDDLIRGRDDSST